MGSREGGKGGGGGESLWRSGEGITMGSGERKGITMGGSRRGGGGGGGRGGERIKERNHYCRSGKRITMGSERESLWEAGIGSGGGGVGEDGTLWEVRGVTTRESGE